jgi:hypothetical protein
MTDAELLSAMNAICHHQVARSVHPLTCGNDSNHPPLFPLVHAQRIVLRCAHCDYRQTYLPDIVRPTCPTS